jgi:DNA repair protein RadC
MTYSNDDHKIISEAREALARYVSQGPLLSSWSMLTDYLCISYAGERREVFRVLFLDKKNRLIEDWEAGAGTISHVPVFPREVIRKALELDASAMILTHNHPSGDVTPSRDDILMTKHLMKAAKLFDITIHDHVIIGGDRFASLRAEGHM